MERSLMQRYEQYFFCSESNWPASKRGINIIVFPSLVLFLLFWFGTTFEQDGDVIVSVVG